VKAPGNLPGQVTSFVGREVTLMMARDRLQMDRLVSLVGPGGCGKTRLAIEVGRDVADSRDDGVFFVDLSGISDPGLVPATVLRVFGLRDAPGRDPSEVLVNWLYERHEL
jgi:predicted ATPase